MKWLNTVKETYNTLHEVTQDLLRFCIGYISATVLCSVAAYLVAGRFIAYYTAMAISADLLCAVRPCVVLSAVGVLLMESTLRRSQ